MKRTAEEIRARIIDCVAANGGHLASSLGAVELSMALDEVFDAETDRVVWDVGHQAYAWKILTGRDDRFDTLRQLDGVAPFPTPLESRADAAVAGHAGSAMSVALGLAAARDARGTGENVVAVIGDASIVNGHSFEAINNCAAATKKLIVVLNDNDMAISKPAGSFAKFLGRLITGVRYNRVKAAAEAAGHKLKLTFLRGIYHRVESRVKGLFLANRYFEQFGLRYIGPVDGHDLAALVSAFTVAKEDKRSVIVHVVTKKGKGYAPAERNPTKYHGVSANALNGGVIDPALPRDSASPNLENLRVKNKRPGWSDVFGDLLVAAARRDERIVALTAGMADGTGLAGFAKEFPRRFFDVGIAEGHMVSFAAGLAAGGLRPVVCVYSTFLQRAIDQVIHDVAIAKLPVVFCIDRAGVVGADGATHQGLYDVALLKAIPNLTIVQPCDEDELKAMLGEALGRDGPTAIRYPRGECPEGLGVRGGVVDPALPKTPQPDHNGRAESTTPPRAELAIQLAGPDAAVQVWALGDYVPKALALAERTGCGVVYARSLKPFDAALLAKQRAAGKKIVSLENGSVAGGFGESIGADLRLGWPDAFVPHGSVADLERRYGLDVDALATRIAQDPV